MERTPLFVEATPTSLYTPSAMSIYQGATPGKQVLPQEIEEKTPKELLNGFLSSRDISPVRTSMSLSWDTAAERTRRHYMRKAKKAVFAVLDEIAPQNSAKIFNAMKEVVVDEEEKCHVDSALLKALAECYENSDFWANRRQILSIMADKVSFKTILQYIPELTRYRFNVARHHQLLHGRGSEVTVTSHARIKVPLGDLDHFLAFITSSRIVIDMPFGEKTLKGSTIDVKVPNVIRVGIPEHIIKQYFSYCH